MAALVVAGLMARAGYRLLRDSSRVLLEAAPRGLDPTAIDTAIRSQPGVTGVHELHVWEVTSGFPALSAHVLVDTSQDCHGRRGDIEELLRGRFAIEHTTLQVDHHDDVFPADSLHESSHPGHPGP